MEDTNEQLPMEEDEPEDKKRPADESAEQPKKKPSALQQQIQKQLQEQLQQQLQAAAARGQSANITPEQIQAQASAMVQAAAQAQAVVNTTKTRNWQPMNAQQIAQLSQIQAAAIVQARKVPAAQVTTQIQIQAQALVHAHTQAQIQAGIYKGDEKDSKPAATEPASSDTMAVEAPKTVLNPDFANPAFLDDGVPADSNSPEFQKQLSDSLNEFWKGAFAGIVKLENQTEQDFKNHNDLPLARIKRIMKSDEDVRMISAEAPVLFAKACELFILDLSIRSWNYSVLHKRRTLQKEDVKEAVQKTDVFDFLVDILH